MERKGIQWKSYINVFELLKRGERAKEFFFLVKEEFRLNIVKIVYIIFFYKILIH